VKNSSNGLLTSAMSVAAILGAANVNSVHDYYYCMRQTKMYQWL
jgi:hypothetical protein